MNTLISSMYDVMNFFKDAGIVLLIAVALAGIFIVLYFSITKIKNKTLAILLSTFVSCILVIPVITSFNHLIERKVEGSIVDEGRAEIKAVRAEVAKAKAENQVKILEREKLENQITIAKQTIEIESLNNSNMLLERAKLSMESFEKIAELALTQANFSQTLVKKEPLYPPKEGWGILAEYFNDEVLVVIVHDINAKFGVDLKEVKITKVDPTTVVVSGIRPKFIGADKNESKTLIKEIRRNNYIRGVLSSVERKNDRTSIALADTKAELYEIEFQKKLSQGMELYFMDAAITQLAQNFIKIVLAPLYSDIRFETTARPNAMPLMDYLRQELKDNNEERYELLRINEQILLANEILETQMATIETNIESENDL